MRNSFPLTAESAEVIPPSPRPRPSFAQAPFLYNGSSKHYTDTIADSSFPPEKRFRAYSEPSETSYNKDNNAMLVDQSPAQVNSSHPRHIYSSLPSHSDNNNATSHFQSYENEFCIAMGDAMDVEPTSAMCERVDVFFDTKISPKRQREVEKHFGKYRSGSRDDERRVDREQDANVARAMQLEDRVSQAKQHLDKVNRHRDLARIRSSGRSLCFPSCMFPEASQ